MKTISTIVLGYSSPTNPVPPYALRSVQIKQIASLSFSSLKPTAQSKVWQSGIHNHFSTIRLSEQFLTKHETLKTKKRKFYGATPCQDNLLSAHVQGLIVVVRIGGDDLLASVDDVVVFARVLAVVIAHIVQDLTGQLNVIVCELADLSIVDTEDLSFFAGTEREAWDQVHDEENDTGSAERVDASGDGVRQLVAELDPVVIEPSSRDFGETIEMRYVVCGEEASQDVTDESPDCVDGEDVKSIVDADNEL